jgi:glucokinase
VVGDLGGTNARFALANSRTRSLNDPLKMPTHSASTLAALVGEFLDKQGGPAPSAACFACAGPILGDRVALTNADLEFSVEESRRRLGLDRLLIVNDFAAIARAAPVLTASDLFPLGGAIPSPSDGPSVVVGPGTGLGVATVAPRSEGWVVIAGEGGHVAMSGLYDDELAVLRALRQRYGFASAEMVLSGPGMTRLFEILSASRGETNGERLGPEVVVDRALVEGDETCLAALDMFCRLLAVTAANAALTVSAVGGVFLAGGILRRFPRFVERGEFRARFEAHPQAARYLRDIATAIVMTPEPGLIGAMHLLADDAAAR